MEEQIDVVFLETTAGQKSREVSSMVIILHVVDIQSLTHTSVIRKKGMDKHAVASLQSFREELDRQKVALRSECGSTVTALTREAGRRREAENGWTTIVERISGRLSQVFGVLEHGLSVQCCAHQYRSPIRSRSLSRLLQNASLVRHTAWMMQHYVIRRDKAISFERLRVDHTMVTCSSLDMDF